MDCKHCDEITSCCMNHESKFYGGECQEFECNEFDKYFDSTEELLYRYLRLEQRAIDNVYASDEFDKDAKRYLGRLYGAKVELLEELIGEIYG